MRSGASPTGFINVHPSQSVEAFPHRKRAPGGDASSRLRWQNRLRFGLPAVRHAMYPLQGFRSTLATRALASAWARWAGGLGSNRVHPFGRRPAGSKASETWHSTEKHVGRRTPVSPTTNRAIVSSASLYLRTAANSLLTKQVDRSVLWHARAISRGETRRKQDFATSADEKAPSMMSLQRTGH